MQIEGDEELLTQAPANLLENAINHVPAPGRITVAGRAPDSVAVLDVADDGPGVPADERKRIFQRLYRLDQSRTTPGSGLGLSLVAAIVELHGGEVEALDNDPGLRVRITLPLFDPAANGGVAGPAQRLKLRAGRGRGSGRGQGERAGRETAAGPRSV